MPTNYETDDYNFFNNNSEFLCGAKDDIDFDSIYDETFQQQFTSDFDIHIPFDNSIDVLLQDATADQIIFEATRNNESLWNSNITPKIPIPHPITNTDDLKMEILSSLGSSSDEDQISSHSPTPSSNSSEDYLTNQFRYIQPQSKDPMLINGNLCQMLVLNPPTNKKIAIPKSTVGTSRNGTKSKKTSVIYPKMVADSPTNVLVGEFVSPDLKALKRQQRMIKNRESASISRKRKKDYVASLEKQLEDLSKENRHLKQENTLLRQQLCSIQTQKNPTRKQTAILLAVVITLSINLPGLTNLFSNSSTSNGIEPTDFHSRHLLSIEPESTLNETSHLNETISANQTTCTYQNETENVRLEQDLRKISSTRRRKFDDLFYRRIPSKLQRKWYRQDELQFYHSFHLMNELDFLDKNDDTFYVVSLKPDMFISATSHNHTSRPKMALLMPTITNDNGGHKNDSSKGDRITLMKIDCEVTNTNILHLKEKRVPQTSRLFPNSTETGISNSGVNSPKNISLAKKRYKFNYKPYFIKDMPDLSNNYDLKMKNFRFL